MRRPLYLLVSDRSGEPDKLDAGDISHPAGRAVYSAALARLEKAQEGGCPPKAVAQELLDEAVEARSGDLHSAYTYLALGTALSDSSIGNIHDAGHPVSAVVAFHRAGHGLREIGQLNRAGDAYWRAGWAGVGQAKREGSPVAGMAIRSFARAKMCYSEIGETQRSDEMHCCEWDARRLLRRKPVVFLWNLTSRYGTSLGRWLSSVVLIIVLFTGAYQLLHDYGLLNPAPRGAWTSVITPLYFTVVTSSTVGYGDIAPAGWVGQLVVIANIVAAYALLGVGATILGRKVLMR